MLTAPVWLGSAWGGGNWGVTGRDVITRSTLSPCVTPPSPHPASPLPSPQCSSPWGDSGEVLGCEVDMAEKGLYYPLPTFAKCGYPGCCWRYIPFTAPVIYLVLLS